MLDSEKKLRKLPEFNQLFLLQKLALKLSSWHAYLLRLEQNIIKLPSNPKAFLQIWCAHFTEENNEIALKKLIDEFCGNNEKMILSELINKIHQHKIKISKQQAKIYQLLKKNQTYGELLHNIFFADNVYAISTYQSFGETRKLSVSIASKIMPQYSDRLNSDMKKYALYINYGLATICIAWDVMLSIFFTRSVSLAQLRMVVSLFSNKINYPAAIQFLGVNEITGAKWYPWVEQTFSFAFCMFLCFVMSQLSIFHEDSFGLFFILHNLFSLLVVSVSLDSLSYLNKRILPRYELGPFIIVLSQILLPWFLEGWVRKPLLKGYNAIINHELFAGPTDYISNDQLCMQNREACIAQVENNLGFPFDGSKCRELKAQLHPDKTGGDHNRFIQITKICSLFFNPTKKTAPAVLSQPPQLGK